MTRDESGMVTAFVVVMVMALLLFAGLVFDGGMGLAAKRQAFNEAEAAARAGAQALDVDAYRSRGDTQLNADQARLLATNYINATGDRGDVVVNGDVITVTVHRTQSMAILGIAGIRNMQVSGTGTATAIRGVDTQQ